MLTKQHLDALRTNFAGIDRFPVHMLDPLRGTLSKLTPADLKRVANAEIKFVSAIAKNMVNEQKRA